MKNSNLIFKSFWFFRRNNLTVALGMAIGIAVITGALITGDSVRSGLQRLVGIRLGNADLTITAGDRYLTDSLSVRISADLSIPSAAVLQLEGSASSEGGAVRIPRVRIYGIDEAFAGVLGPGTLETPSDKGQAVISDNLAARLNVLPGDEILLRINKPGPVPIDAPFVSSEENIVTVRLTVATIAGKEHHGRFHLQNTQTAPFNVFLDRENLQKLAGLDGLSNLIVLSGKGQVSATEVARSLSSCRTLADAGLNLQQHPVTREWVLRTPRVFFDEPAVSAITHVDASKSFWFSYFVNELRFGDRATPYSFVSTLPGNTIDPGDIQVNRWLADDLGVSTGDSITLTYFRVGTLRNLTTETRRFCVAGILEMDHPLSDRLLMPEIPGLSDAGNCRDWETSIPVDLDKIRDHDEAYWNTFRGTPKAYINPDVAAALWQNRFGRYTQVRFAAETDPDRISQSILSGLLPENQGIRVTETTRQGLSAASTGVDFSGLFLSLSFFLIAGGILLTLLLVRLALEGKQAQVGTFRALGWPERQIRCTLLMETLLVLIPGALIGLIFAWGYIFLVFKALNGVWNPIVLTDTLQPVYRPTTLAAGLLSGLLVSAGSAWLAINTHFRRKPIALLRKTGKTASTRSARLLSLGTSVAFIGAAGLLIYGLSGIRSVDPVVFFSSGTLLLLGILLFTVRSFLKSPPGHRGVIGLISMSQQNLWRNPNRSLSVILLFAIGAFLVIAVGANRKRPVSQTNIHSEAAMQKLAAGGTGAFSFYLETTVPVPDNLNDPMVRAKYGLEEEASFVQLKRLDGDDASCLNLNRVSNPPVLAVPDGSLTGRFTFVTTLTDQPETDIWKLLEQELPGGAIPAVADQTVIQWGLMVKVGDTLHYQAEDGTPVDLVLVGGLAGSIFQGNVLIGEQAFMRLWPSVSGTNVILIQADATLNERIQTDISRVFRDHGIELAPAARKLAEFSSVENTYLSIFLVMGALAMLLGTIGLALVMARGIQERAPEIALLRSLGFSRKRITRLLMLEYSTLLAAGSVAGIVPALVSVLPGLINPAGEVPVVFLIVMSVSLILNGWIWILGIGWVSVKKTGLVARLRND